MLENKTLHHTQLLYIEAKLSEIIKEVENRDRGYESIIEDLTMISNFIKDNVIVDVDYSLENTLEKIKSQNLSAQSLSSHYAKQLTMNEII